MKIKNIFKLHDIIKFIDNMTVRNNIYIIVDKYQLLLYNVNRVSMIIGPSDKVELEWV